MENQFLDSNLNVSDNNGGLSSTDKDNLLVAAKWARFLGIVGYVLTAFIALAGLFMMFGMSSLMSVMGDESPVRGIGGLGAAAGIIYLALAALYFFMAKYLYNFGTRTRDGINNNSADSLSEGIQNLRSHFSLIGIITAIFLGIYALIIVFALIAGSFAAMAR